VMRGMRPDTMSLLHGYHRLWPNIDLTGFSGATITLLSSYNFRLQGGSTIEVPRHRIMEATLRFSTAVIDAPLRITGRRSKRAQPQDGASSSAPKRAATELSGAAASSDPPGAVLDPTPSSTGF